MQVKYKKHLPGLYTFKTRLTADFGQIWIFEKQVPGPPETWNFVWSMAGGQLDHCQNFRWKSLSQAEIENLEICVFQNKN